MDGSDTCVENCALWLLKDPSSGQLWGNIVSPLCGPLRAAKWQRANARESIEAWADVQTHRVRNHGLDPEK